MRSKLGAGVLELVDFIRKENIKSLVEHIVDQHLERWVAPPHVQLSFAFPMLAVLL